MGILCYNCHALKKSSSKPDSKPCGLKCHNCGSDLVVMEVTTMTLGNNLYPITKTVYKCTNKECQDDSDQKNAAKAKIRHEQEAARQKRAEDSKIASAAAKILT